MTRDPALDKALTILDSPHRRTNALTGESVLVSPQRSQRPWQGKIETTPPAVRPQFDPACYLCPGNARAGGERNPQYDSTYVFTNDFPAILPTVPGEVAASSSLLHADPVRGECRVLCFSPRHDLTLAEMSIPQIRSVVDTWAEQTTELGSRWRWVQVFENKGEIMGCSNPHPHGQIWASDFLPNEPAKELRQQNAWFQSRGTPLLIEYASLETAAAERVVVQTTHWLAVVPWWAIWPFETLILPRRHVSRLPDLNAPERDDLALLLKDLLSRYDELFQTSFPYSMGWHGAPTDDGDYSGWQLHAHILPPLLRSATVKKFMVGYELLAQPQRDLTPEQAARQLRQIRR
jgi:UDPglucose--hexose-1-phosphate uridylyltransferase